MKKISVVIPCFNIEEEIFKNTIKSLAKQTMSSDEYEVILVNDASTDDGITEKILRDCESEYSFIKVINLSTNHRQGGARNVGIDEANGEYLLLCDSDDWYDLDAFETLYRLAKQNDLEIVEYDYYVDESMGEATASKREDSTITIEIIDSEEKRKRFFVEQVSMLSWNKLYKMNLIRKNRVIFTEKVRFYEEATFTYIARFFVTRYGTINQKMYHYLQRDESSGHTLSVDESVYWLMNEYEVLREAFDEHGIDDRYLEEKEFVFWSGYFFMPSIALANTKRFWTKEEFRKIQENVRANVSCIYENKYYKETFGEFDALGKLAYVDADVLDMDELQEVFDSFGEIA